MTSQEFFNLFNLKEGSDYIRKYIWEGPTKDVGFGIVKHYPQSKRFKVVKKLNGEADSAVIIKVLLYSKTEEETTYYAGVAVSKISLYQLDKNIHFEKDYDYSDLECPTKESIDLSLKSVQPINLEEMTRFTFDIVTNKFKDTRTKKDITPQEIIDFIYKEHVDSYESIRGTKLKFKVAINNFILKSVITVGELLIKIIPKLSGKKIENEFYNLFFQPFNWVEAEGIKDNKSTELIEYDNLLKKINPNTFSVVTFIILLLYVGYTYFCSDFFHVIDFIKKNKDDQIFSVTLITFVVLFFNYVFPNILLFTLNLLIRIHQKLSFVRFEL